MFNLLKLSPGKVGRIEKINLGEVLKERLHKLGFIKDVEVEFFKSSPFGDPRVYRVLNTLFALRNKIAENILVEIKKTTHEDH